MNEQELCNLNLLSKELKISERSKNFLTNDTVIMTKFITPLTLIEILDNPLAKESQLFKA